MFRIVVRVLGWIVNAWKGPSITTVYLGPVENSVFLLQPTVNDPEVEIGVRSTQVVYRTHYRRPWIFDRTHMVFEVVGYAPEEHRANINPALFTPVTYPLLCHSLLQWTQYPHVYAIHAYLDRIWPHDRPSQVFV